MILWHMHLMLGQVSKETGAASVGVLQDNLVSSTGLIM